MSEEFNLRHKPMTPSEKRTATLSAAKISKNKNYKLRGDPVRPYKKTYHIHN